MFVRKYVCFILNWANSSTQLEHRRCNNVVPTSLLTLSQRSVTFENENYADFIFRRYHNVAVRRCQDVAATSPQH